MRTGDGASFPRISCWAQKNIAILPEKEKKYSGAV
jgi:hypothetical protein